LYNRKQYVHYNGVDSDYKPITCGVPQGSILGPLLFILYINDIVNYSDILKFILFADDTNVFHSHKQMSELVKSVNYELEKLSEWFRSNKLSLNVQKTNYIIFTNKKIPEDDQLTLDGRKLERVVSTKFLGVVIDERLNWAEHVNYISIKISKSLGVLGRVKHILSSSSLLMLYHTMIFPYLNYCNIIWGCAKPTVINKLTVLQKRAVRLVTRSSYRTSTGPLFSKLRLLKLVDIHKLQTVLFMFKFKQHLLPVSCMHYFTVNTNRSYVTRNTSYFNLFKISYMYS